MENQQILSISQKNTDNFSINIEDNPANRQSPAGNGPTTTRDGHLTIIRNQCRIP